MNSPHRYTEIPLVLVAAICLIGAELGQLVVVPVGDVALPAFWPPVGMLAGTLILADRRRWTRLLAAACGAMILSAAILHGRPFVQSVGLSVIVGLEAFVAAWLVLRSTEEAFALNRFSHTWAFVVCSTLVPAAGGLLASNLLLVARGPSFLIGWRAWWLAESLGMLMTGPLLIAAVTERAAFAKIFQPWKALEMAVVFAGGIVVAVGIFGEEVDPLLRIPAYLLPFLLWPVFRFGPGASSAILFIVSLVGLWNANQGQGPFAMAGAPAVSIVLRSQGSMAVVAVSFLLLASVVAERKRVAQEYAALVDEVQRAMTEIKTLRGFIPICAWCHKVRDDAGFWQEIEKYLNARTDATFSHSICPACEEEAHAEIESHGLDGRAS